MTQQLSDGFSRELLIQLAKAARRIAGEDEGLHDVVLAELMAAFDRFTERCLDARSV